jgi:hypothetical protein
MNETPIVARWTGTDGVERSEPLVVHGDPHSDPDTPVVILLHGTDGTIDDMSKPTAHALWGFDAAKRYPDPVPRGEHSLPGIGVWGFTLDDPAPPATGWQPALDAQGFLTLNYGQVEPGGRLQSASGGPGNPMLQLQGVVDAVIEAFPGRRIAFVTHSRGGILLRAWLMQSGGRPEIAARLSSVVMLHSPNAGTRIANIALRVGSFVQGLETVLGPLKPVAWLTNQTRLPALEDYREGSALLATLDGAPPPTGMAFHTFGGTSTMLTRVHQWGFTLDSAIPDITLDGLHVSVRFHWATGDGPVLGISALANDLGGLGIPELTDGEGDVLVSNASATLPFAQHHEHAVHHAQALWDPDVIADGGQVLQGARGAPSDGTIDDGWIELVGVPAQVGAGAAFGVQLRAGNAGTSPWDGAHAVTIGDDAGHAVWGTPSVAVPGTVLRGESVSVPVLLTAPGVPGTYAFRAGLRGPNGPIGRPVTATVTVP